MIKDQKTADEITLKNQKGIYKTKVKGLFLQITKSEKKWIYRKNAQERVVIALSNTMAFSQAARKSHQLANITLYDSISFGDFWAFYFEDHCHKWSQSYIKRTKQLVDGHLKPILFKENIRHLTEQKINELFGTCVSLMSRHTLDKLRKRLFQTLNYYQYITGYETPRSKQCPLPHVDAWVARLPTIEQPFFNYLRKNPEFYELIMVSLFTLKNPVALSKTTVSDVDSLLNNQTINSQTITRISALKTIAVIRSSDYLFVNRQSIDQCMAETAIYRFFNQVSKHLKQTITPDSLIHAWRHQSEKKNEFSVIK